MDIVKRILRTMKRNQEWLVLGAGTVAVTIAGVQLAKKYALDWQNGQLRSLLKEKEREKCYQAMNEYSNRLLNLYAVSFRKAIFGHFRARKDALAAEKSTLNKLEYLNVVKTDLILDVMLYIHASVLFVVAIKVWHFVFEGNCKAAGAASASAASAATVTAVSSDFKEKFYSSIFSLLVKSVANLNECLEKDFKKVVRELNIYRVLSLKDIDILFANYHTNFLENYAPFNHLSSLFAEKFSDHFFDENSPTTRAILTEIRDLFKTNELLGIYKNFVRTSDAIVLDELYHLQFKNKEIAITSDSSSLMQLNNNCGNFVTFLPKLDTILRDKQFYNSIITHILNQKNLQTFQNNLFQSYYQR